MNFKIYTRKQLIVYQRTWATFDTLKNKDFSKCKFWIINYSPNVSVKGFKRAKDLIKYLNEEIEPKLDTEYFNIAKDRIAEANKAKEKK